MKKMLVVLLACLLMAGCSVPPNFYNDQRALEAAGGRCVTLDAFAPGQAELWEVELHFIPGGMAYLPDGTAYQTYDGSCTFTVNGQEYTLLAEGDRGLGAQNLYKIAPGGTQTLLHEAADWDQYHSSWIITDGESLYLMGYVEDEVIRIEGTYLFRLDLQTGQAEKLALFGPGTGVLFTGCEGSTIYLSAYESPERPAGMGWDEWMDYSLENMAWYRYGFDLATGGFVWEIGQ